MLILRRKWTSDPRIAWVWVTCWTLFAIGLLVLGFRAQARVPHASNALVVSEVESRSLPTKPIEEVRVGDRVVAWNPEVPDSERAGPSQLDLTGLRKVALRLTQADGSVVDLELLRPVDWLEAVGSEVSSSFYLSIEDVGIEGDAQVLRVEPCPPLNGGYGRLVTGTFTHHSAAVVELRFVGVPDGIGVTSNHPVWSADRDCFVPAGELSEGERLDTINGEAAVASLTPRPGLYQVYNLEVETEHTFFVGDDGILVHNGCSVASMVRKGKIGETLAKIPKGIPKPRIDSLSGTAKRRYPDLIRGSFLKEVKNRSEVRLTNQLRDFILHAKKEKLTFVLQTRKGADVDQAIRKFAKANGVKMIVFNGLVR